MDLQQINRQTYAQNIIFLSAFELEKIQEYYDILSSYANKLLGQLPEL